MLGFGLRVRVRVRVRVTCCGETLALVEPLGESLLREAAYLLGVRRLLLEARQQALPRRRRPPQPGGYDLQQGDGGCGGERDRGGESGEGPKSTAVTDDRWWH